MIRGNQLITPRLTDSVLESITRDTVIKLAVEELGMGSLSAPLTVLRYMADEAFLCGSAMEVTPYLYC